MLGDFANQSFSSVDACDLNFYSFAFVRISIVSQTHLKAAEKGSPELDWIHHCLLEVCAANTRLLKACGPTAVKHYLIGAAIQPKLNTALQLHLQRLSVPTITTVFVDCHNPPKHRLFKMSLPKSVTVAAMIKAIIAEQKRLVQGDISCHDADLASQYLLKVCCSPLSSR